MSAATFWATLGCSAAAFDVVGVDDDGGAEVEESDTALADVHETHFGEKDAPDGAPNDTSEAAPPPDAPSDAPDVPPPTDAPPPDTAPICAPFGTSCNVLPCCDPPPYVRCGPVYASDASVAGHYCGA